MRRYLKVRGKPGQLVANPHVLDANPRRFAGQRSVYREDPKPGEKAIEFADRYEPVDEVLLDHPDLRTASRDGEIVVVAEGIGDAIESVEWRTTPPPDEAEALRAAHAQAIAELEAQHEAELRDLDAAFDRDRKALEVKSLKERLQAQQRALEAPKET